MYSVANFLQFVISGVSVGCIYGLVGIGFSVIYNASSIANFAQGAFVMLGGMLTYLLYTVVGLPLFIAAVLAILAVAAIGLLMEIVVVNPLWRRHAPVFTLILATLACQVIAENSALRLLGDKPHTLPLFTDGPPFKIFGAAVSLQFPWIIGVSLLMVWLLRLLYKHTMLGKAMRACAINREVAQILGIRVEWMMAVAFALSAGIGAVGGILITPLQYTAFFVGIPYAVSGFVAAIIGGLGNPLGAFVGGIILGVLQSVGIIFLASGYKDVVAFSALILLLLVRPNGLFGSLVEEQ
jgi:branched-chain amino acid transport system permease protein